MRIVSALVLVTALVVVATPVLRCEEPSGPSSGREGWFEVFHEDWENGGQGWIFEDRTGRPSEFHATDYYAYDDGTPPNYSYWCGTFEYDANGGYGCGWNMLLELPEIDLAGATQPKLRFRYRIETATGDRVTVEAMKGGTYEVLDGGVLSGSGAGWIQVPIWGISLVGCDNPLKLRLRFRSNEMNSDEDGWDSDGGAFHCDEIRVYESGVGTDYFYDDVEDGVGLCTAVDIPPTGHIPWLIELPCRAYSSPTCVTISEPGDTVFVPPNVFLSVTTPPIHLEWALECTVHYAGAHCGDGDVTDVRLMQASFDGGETWILVARNTYGIEEVDGCKQYTPWGIPGYAISEYLPAHSMILRLSVYTDEDGISAGVTGAAGSFLDDVWVNVYGWTAVPEEEVSWSVIKGPYR
jgi:hypothetical protein